MKPADGDLAARPLGEVLDELAVGELGPASGAATALAVALAAATIGKAAGRSRATWDGAGGVAAQADALRRRALRLAGDVGEAYVESVRRLREPASGAQQARDFELGQALGQAARIPALIAEAAADASLLAETVADNCEDDVRADAVAAALLAHGAARAGANLVRVNLAVTDGDERMATALLSVRAASDACDRLAELVR